MTVKRKSKKIVLFRMNLFFYFFGRKYYLCTKNTKNQVNENP